MNLAKVSLVLLGLFGNFVYAQNPGNVKGYSYWFNNPHNPEMDSIQNKCCFNFNKVVNFDYRHNFNFEQNLESDKGISIFSIFKNNILNSNIVNIDHLNESIVLHSTGVTSSDQLNYSNPNYFDPQFISYLESKKLVQDSISSVALAKNNLDNRDYLNFEGDIAEIIVYPKVLPKIQRRKVETYLSLKYGISLDTNHSYINSKNDTIWDAEKMSPFNYRVTGIGRDDLSSLNQKQSRNISDEYVVSLGINRIDSLNSLNNSTIEDSNYLLWGDNNGPLHKN